MKILQILATKLASIEIWVISASVLISMIYPNALLSVVIVGVFFWFIRRAAYKQFTSRSPIDISILFLLLLIPINLWITAIPSKTYPQVYRLLTGVIFLYTISNWGRTVLRIRWLVYSAIFINFMLALFATISVEWAQNKLIFIPAALYDRFILLVHDTVHRNVMAGALVILYPIALGMILFTWRSLRGWHRFLLAIAAGTVLVILILTQSRAALLALAVIFLGLIVMRWKWGWAAIPISMLATLGLILYLGVGNFVILLSSGVSLQGLEGRIEVWSRAIYMIQDFPLTGVGLGLFGDVADSMYPFFVNTPGSIPHAHNLFLQIAVDLGIPGLITWLSILFSVMVMSWQLYKYGRSRADDWTAGLGAGLLCSQVGLIVHGFLDAATWGGVRSAPIVWAIWGLTIAAWTLSRRRITKSLDIYSS
jgi:putative inorganic carbon (HCO3(-)) transporter